MEKKIWNDLETICKEFHIDHKIEKQNFLSESEKIEHKSNQLLNNNEDIRLLKRKILKLRCDFKNYKFYNGPTGQKFLNELKQNSKYSVDDTHIIYNGYLPIRNITYKGRYKNLQLDEMESFKHLGYGITSFRINKLPILTDIVCDGSHPNVNPRTKELCFSSELKCKDLSLNILQVIEFILSSSDLDKSYLSSNDIDKIRRLVKI